jgi:hypothetical protein
LKFTYWFVISVFKTLFSLEYRVTLLHKAGSRNLGCLYKTHVDTAATMVAILGGGVGEAYGGDVLLREERQTGFKPTAICGQNAMKRR